MSAYLDWHAGMKVVFVSEGQVSLIRSGWRKWLPNKRLTHQLVVGETYTISGLVTHFDHIRHSDIVCIYLAGFAFKESAKVAFPAIWFRRVQTKASDISVFTEMLTDTKVDA